MLYTCRYKISVANSISVSSDSKRKINFKFKKSLLFKLRILKVSREYFEGKKTLSKAVLAKSNNY